MNAEEERRFALAHLTFERNAAMARDGNNGIKDAENLLAPLGWRWVAARLVPRREVDPEHEELVDAIEGLVDQAQSLLDDHLYLGRKPDEDAMWELREALDYLEQFEKVPS